MQKNSVQRNSIKKMLHGRTDHPTAADIYKEIQKEYPNISLGTVYRNLKLMQELGEIKAVLCNDDSVHYDANISPHYHHICTKCGAVHDIPMQVIGAIDELSQRFTEDLIDSHEMSFYGICRDCRETETVSSINQVH